MIFVWWTWFRVSSKINIKNYNPENDKGRQAEEKRRRAGGFKEAIGREFANTRDSPTTSFSDEGFRESEEPRVLQTTETIVDGKTSNSDGKVSKQFRNPFRRKRK